MVLLSHEIIMIHKQIVGVVRILFLFFSQKVGNSIGDVVSSEPCMSKKFQGFDDLIDCSLMDAPQLIHTSLRS